METQIDNMQKYANYREQFGRLNRAVTSRFYLEAIFIEYAIIEDRFESMLRHSERFNPKKHNKIESKLNTVSEMQREAKGLTRKYFSEEIIEQVYDWKNKRNTLIHALLKQALHTEELEQLALQGRDLAKCISAKVSCYNKALDKLKNKK